MNRRCSPSSYGQNKSVSKVSTCSTTGRYSREILAQNLSVVSADGENQVVTLTFDRRHACVTKLCRQTRPELDRIAAEV